MISRGEFGAVAVAADPRPARAARRSRATFFIPGHTALAYPDLIREIRDAATRSATTAGCTRTRRTSTSTASARSSAAASKRSSEVAGVRPRGLPLAVGRLQPQHDRRAARERHRLRLVAARRSDFTPYYLRQGDKWSNDRAVRVRRRRSTWSRSRSTGASTTSPHFEFEAGFTVARTPRRPSTRSGRASSTTRTSTARRRLQPRAAPAVDRARPSARDARAADRAHGRERASSSSRWASTPSAGGAPTRLIRGSPRSRFTLGLAVDAPTKLDGILGQRQPGRARTAPGKTDASGSTKKPSGT